MPTEPARSGPKSLPDRLRQEKGGVPVWLWIAGGTTAAVALYILWKRRQAPKVTGAMEYTPAYRNSTGYDGAGGAAGGGSGGGGNVGGGVLPLLDQPLHSEVPQPAQTAPTSPFTSAQLAQFAPVIPEAYSSVQQFTNPLGGRTWYAQVDQTITQPVPAASPGSYVQQVSYGGVPSYTITTDPLGNQVWSS